MKKYNKTLTSKIKKIETIFQEQYEIITPNIEKIIDEMMQNEEGQQTIAEIIVQRVIIKKEKPQPIDGLIYQKIINENNTDIKKQLINKLPQGLLDFKSYTKVNYQKLQNLLVKQKFQEADTLTQKYLCELTQQNNNSKKNWLYFTDIQFLSQEDLFILDSLWKIYSKGKFCFSIQKKIWIKNNRNWDKLWENIYWLKHGIMKRYPEEFIWTIDAPEGHLPLFNQLRGTQTLSYLFHNIKW
uniref:GUN4-like domain-containing protein n=1 Tax=Herposiphonia versicolor TaxID=2007163 RepID=A0A1Z1MFD7_9FLOR|nr:hypothetical protein [Herposiphonia versicolor]ARW64686.1 hypothetical protein [Herposiphonia versicolor]